MKKSGVILFFAIISLLFFVRPTRAEVIRGYDSQITIQKDGKILVKEKVDYDFEDIYKHGIYRYIPFTKKNTDGKQYLLDVVVEGVTDEQGTAYSYSESRSSDTLTIKVGDANRTITGLHTYIITYSVSGALTYFSDHDELYWNSTGNGWSAGMENVNTTVHFPEGMEMNAVKIACYTGAQGSVVSDCTTITEQNSVSSSALNLTPGSGLTIAVSFPKGVVAVLEPQLYTPFEETLLGKIIITLIFIALGIGGLIWYIILPIYIPVKWYLTGRDPDSQEARVWFDPPKTKEGRALTPAETGSLIDETVDMRDIFGSLIQLAQKGYFQIVEKKKGEFIFSKKKNWEDSTSLLPFEMNLLVGLFDGSEECQIKGRDLGEEMTQVSNNLYDQVVADGFFVSNPQSTRTKYFAIAGAALFTGNIFLAVVAFIFAKFMPAKTQEGAAQAAVARSLKTFLSSQERQLEFQAKNQMMFEKLLPYAIAFGVEKIWAERFKDISMSKPQWYSSQTNTAFNAIYLSNALHSSVSTFSTSATPTRSSSGFSSGFGGGGFSGGGGGGGGGGSW